MIFAKVSKKPLIKKLCESFVFKKILRFCCLAILGAAVQALGGLWINSKVRFDEILLFLCFLGTMIIICEFFRQFQQFTHRQFMIYSVCVTPLYEVLIVIVLILVVLIDIFPISDHIVALALSDLCPFVCQTRFFELLIKFSSAFDHFPFFFQAIGH